MLQQKAELVANNVAKSNPDLKSTALDPFTILVIINVIATIVKLYLACKKNPKEMLEMSQNPGVIGRWRLRRILKHHLDHDKVQDLMLLPTENSLLEIGAACAEADFAEMVQDVNQMPTTACY